MQTGELLISLIGFLAVTLVTAGTLRDNFDDGDLEGWTPLIWQNGENAIHKVESGEAILQSVRVNPKTIHAFACTRGNNQMQNLQNKPFEWRLNKWCQLKVEAKG